MVNVGVQQDDEVIVEEALERWGRRRRQRLGRRRGGGRGPRTRGRRGAAVAVRRAVDVDAVRAGGRRLGVRRSAGALGSAGGLWSTVGGVELENGGEAGEVRRSSAGSAPRRKRVQGQQGRV